MAIAIREWQDKVINNIDKHLKDADLSSFEFSDILREFCEGATSDIKEFSERYANYWKTVRGMKTFEEIELFYKQISKEILIAQKYKQDKKINELKENNKWWKESNEKNRKDREEHLEWLRKFDAREHDWQKDDKKKEENSKKFEEDLNKNNSKKPDEEDSSWDFKKKFINDIEMNLVKENISQERLSKRLGVSNWKEKINGAADFHEALSRRSDLWDIINKLREEYTCANCGVKKEEYTAYQAGGKKYCSYECKEALKGKDKKSSDSPSKNYKDNFGFSSVSEFFAWMKKMGVDRIEFDVNTNQVIISCNGNKKLSVSDKNTSLTTEQQAALTERFKSDKSPITFNQVNDEFNKNKKDNKGNGGIIAAIVIVGIILAVIIGVVVHKNKRKDYY